jgi:predicted  nucleic acid-binding Zn-ribbon protein
MPNVHMQTAARDLQRAVADLRQNEQQIRNDTDATKREITSQIAQLRETEARLQAQVHQTNDSGVQLTTSALIARNKIEINDLEKRLKDLEDEALRMIQSLEQQATYIDGLSKELQNMA